MFRYRLRTLLTEASPMSRFKRIRNWPDNLKTMPLDELRKELEYWQMRLRLAPLKHHEGEFRKRIHDVEQEIKSRITTE
jgi:hypothetical protein